MATKAIKFYDGTSYLLPVTTSDLVQMNGTTQSLTTYINDIKNSVSNAPNTAKASLSSHVYYYVTRTVYTYISPTGEKDEINGTTLELRKGDNITLSQDGNVITISSSDNYVNQSLLGSTNASKYGLITRPYNRGGNNDSVTSGVGFTNTSFAYVTPEKSYLYSNYTYSNAFVEDGTKLSNKYASINHSHDVTFEFDSQQYTDTNDTVQVISYFNYPLTTAIFLDTVDCTTITYTSTSVPTKKYVDDNFATKTELGNIQTGSEYTIVAASSSSTVNPTLLGMRNGYLNLVNSTNSTVEKSIYIHGNGSGTDIAITGGNVIDVGISHNQDHTGTGSTGCLTYWETDDEHTNVTSSYGANTTNAVGVHYIDSGVLKNVTVSSGSSSLPVYVDGGVIKPVTSTSLLKVYQKTSGTTNAKYPFLTKYTSGVSEITSGDYSRITSNGTNDTLFAYVNPSTKISYFQYAYAGEFTEGGVRLEDKYALKGTGGTDTNTAKVGWYYDVDNDDGEDVYAYVGPNGTQADTTNGVGSTIHFHATGGATIGYENNQFVIGAPVNSDKYVAQYSETMGNYKFPLLTRYAQSSTPWVNTTNYARYSGSSSHEAAYYFPSSSTSTSYLYIERIRTSSILLNGQSITSGGGSSSLDYTVVKNSMDAITIF